MGRILTSLVMLLFIAAGGGQVAVPGSLRVLTYNIHHGEGTDRRLDLPRVAAVIERVRPDVVALQEVDVGTVRAGGVNQLAELARLTRMHGEFGKAIDFDGGDYGVGVLSRWPLVSAAAHPLPGDPDRESRTALTVRLRPGELGPLLAFTSTHFDQGREQENRLAQAMRVNELLLGSGNLPAILAGDMNARSDTQVMQIFDALWTNASIADPAILLEGRPRARGDHVLYRPAEGWRVIEWSLINDTLASDHRPILVELAWTGHH